MTIAGFYAWLLRLCAACPQTGLSTVLLSHLVKRYRSPPSLSVSFSLTPAQSLALSRTAAAGRRSFWLHFLRQRKKQFLAENSDRRVKRDNFSAHSLSLYPGSSSSVSLSPAKPPHPWLLCVSFLSIRTHIFSLSLRGVGCWSFPGELCLREQPVPTVYIVPTGLSERAINREHG